MVCRLRLIILFIFLANPATAAFATPPVTLEGKQPQLAGNGDDVMHLTFGSGNRIFYARSTDGGESFQRPTQIGSTGHLSLGMRRGPRVALSGDAVVITAIGGELGGGRDGDLFTWRSTDDGRNWIGPVRVNDVDASAREGLHAMAAGPQGRLYCVWLDLRNKRTEIMGASSTDGGKTWSENRLVYRSPDGSVCECCHPSVAFAPDGTLFVMWRNSLGGYRDMYLARSKDGGRTFESAVRLGTGTWQLDACPMDGGAFAVDEAGTVHTVWRREKTIYTTDGKPEAEHRPGNGEQPWLALTSEGPAIVWINRRPGELFVKVPGARQPIKLASEARDPVIAGSKGGIVVAWETESKGKPAIRVTTLNAGSLDGPRK